MVFIARQEIRHSSFKILHYSEDVLRTSVKFVTIFYMALTSQEIRHSKSSIRHSKMFPTLGSQIMDITPFRM
jgi:hypothetical protein